MVDKNPLIIFNKNESGVNETIFSKKNIFETKKACNERNFGYIEYAFKKSLNNGQIKEFVKKMPSNAVSENNFVFN